MVHPSTGKTKRGRDTLLIELIAESACALSDKFAKQVGFFLGPFQTENQQWYVFTS